VKFYLGTHEPHWLGYTDVPLFVSHRRLQRRKSYPKALGSWALDSGGFSELSMYGEWKTGPGPYIYATYRYKDEIGHLDWASPQDWMCEPFILEKTGFTVDRHQGLTVENFSVLREHAPDLPWIPVLQGWTIDDYMACIDRYYAAGIDLTLEPRVGVGSVCRRQDLEVVKDLFGQLSDAGLHCHGYGVKTLGLAQYSHLLKSCDSMAWSLNARFRPAMEHCQHKSCRNCIRFALRWREKLLAREGAL
jgi:hypothetical protein